MKFNRRKKSFFLHRLKQKHHPLLFRRAAFLWVFLIILEIGCPLLDCQSFAVDLSVNDSTVSSNLVLTSKSILLKTFTEALTDSQNNLFAADNLSVSGHQSQKEHCNDECLCHITPINVLVFVMPKYFEHSFVSHLNLKFQPSSDLPPPYQPPQFS